MHCLFGLVSRKCPSAALELKILSEYYSYKLIWYCWKVNSFINYEEVPHQSVAILLQSLEQDILSFSNFSAFIEDVQMLPLKTFKDFEI